MTLYSDHSIFGGHGSVHALSNAEAQLRTSSGYMRLTQRFSTSCSKAPTFRKALA